MQGSVEISNVGIPKPRCLLSSSSPFFLRVSMLVSVSPMMSV
jgi:hypothetical protein